MNEKTISESIPSISSRRSGMAAWFAVALLAALSFTQWRGFLYPNYSQAVLLQCGTVVLILLWAFPQWGKHFVRTRASRAGLLLGLYAAWSALSCVYAADKHIAWIGSIVIVFPIFWALALGQLLRRKVHFRLLLRGIVAAGVVAAAVALCHLMQTRTLVSYEELTKVIAAGELAAVREAFSKLSAVLERVFGHRNFLAIFLLPPLLFCLADLMPGLLTRGAAKRGPLAWPKHLLILSVVLMLGVLFLCNSAGGVLALLLGVGFLFGMRLSRRNRVFALACILVAAVAGLVILSLPSVEVEMATLEKGQRWFLWKGAVRMFAKHPVTGWGSGMFLPHFALFKYHEPMRYGRHTLITIYPHNELLLVAVEGGLVALFFYVGGLFSSVRQAVRVGARNTDARWRLTIWVLAAGFVAMFAHGLVSVSLRYWAPATLYWTLIGMMLAVPHLHGQSHRTIPSPWRWKLLPLAKFVCVVAGAYLVSINVIWSGVHAEQLLGPVYRELYARTRHGERIPEERVDLLVEEARRAASHSRYVPDYLMALGLQGKLLGLAPRIPDAINAYKHLDAQAPGYGMARFALARLCMGRYRAMPDAASQRQWLKEAHHWYRKVLEMNSFHYGAHVGMAELLVRSPMRDLPGALRHVEVVTQAPREKGYDRYRMTGLEYLARARRNGAATPAQLAEISALEKRLKAGLSRAAQSPE